MDFATRVTKEITRLSAGDLSALAQARKLSPREIVETHLRRIAEINPGLNAFIHIAAEEARAHARVLETIRDRGQMPLYGVPISIKGCIDVAGMPSPCGSELRRDYIAQQDAPLVARLKRAGAVVIGVTNTPEFLMAWETDNRLFGPTRNPLDENLSAGGSSGGEAAAIASGMSAGGIGSDGGGSVRVPAAFCGICGLKPTPGRIPTTGHFPDCFGPFAHLGVVGPMARTVDDVELLFRVTAGFDLGDPLSSPCMHAEPPAKRFRIGLLYDASASAEAQRAVKAAASALETAGAAIEPFAAPEFEEATELWHSIFFQAGALGIRSNNTGKEEQFSPFLLAALAYANSLGPLAAAQLLDATTRRDALRARFLGRMNCDALLLPVCTTTAFALGESERDYAGVVARMGSSYVFNLLGMPAMSVPFGRSDAGLPLAIQLAAKPYHEPTLFAIAKMVENSRPS